MLREMHIEPTALDNGFVPVDIDVTPFDNSKSNKEGVSCTYKGFDGYAPIMAYIGTEGYLVNLELWIGKQHCQKETPDFLRETIELCRQLTEKPLLIRLDSGNDASENIGIFNRAGIVEKEGENLRNDILIKLDEMKENVTFIEERYPAIVSEYRKKLEDKVAELLEDSNIDESRIAAEVVIYSDKICVDEETVRLKSHIDGMRDELLKGGNVGRKLDFIAQEMNREANTILSKANDIEVSDHAIDLKTEIEKIREQVQNIE